MDRDRGYPYWMEGPHYEHDEWWHGPLHLVLALLLAGLLVLGIVWLVRRLRQDALASGLAAPMLGATTAGGATAWDADPAVGELRLRYARGEIDRDAYLQSFADLTGRAEAWPGQTAPDAPTATPPAPGT